MAIYPARNILPRVAFLTLATVFCGVSVFPQVGGGHTLFGDFRVDDSQVSELKPVNFHLILYNTSGSVVERQTIVSGGRYRFMRVPNGEYYIVVEMENSEIARIHLTLTNPIRTDVRHDISLEWRTPLAAGTKPSSISIADFYKRSESNEKLFLKAKEATDQKRYDDSILTLQALVAADPKDYQAWAELGTVYLFKQNYDESEKAYIKSVTERPGFFLGQMNLGRLRIMRKDFEGAIEPLTAAANINALSADANYYLGEAYLQIKKGSKAVGYLYQAIKLDPIGKADVHLRLATLYNAVGMKDKAAIEYEEFLKKKPAHPESKKLRDYITANKPK